MRICRLAAACIPAVDCRPFESWCELDGQSMHVHAANDSFRHGEVVIRIIVTTRTTADVSASKAWSKRRRKRCMQKPKSGERSPGARWLVRLDWIPVIVGYASKVVKESDVLLQKQMVLFNPKVEKSGLGRSDIRALLCV